MDELFKGQFLRGYMACALWASSNESGEGITDDHDSSHMSKETLTTIASDCEAFLVAVGDVPHEAFEPTLGDAQSADNESLADQMGHDFWLTRNGHGAGFWDGDWAAGSIGDDDMSHCIYSRSWTGMDHYYSVILSWKCGFCIIRWPHDAPGGV